jgi:hypothetical protein
MSLIAECCCGECKIEIKGSPELHGLCHCKNCRKRTGSAFGISTYFNKSQVVGMFGNTTVYRLHNTEQNHDQERHFCSYCGTTLYWHISTLPEKIGIAGGCFIEASLGEPTYSANDSQKCNWLTLPDEWKIQA